MHYVGIKITLEAKENTQWSVCHQVQEPVFDPLHACKKPGVRPSQMIQWVKVPAFKPDNLRLIPGTHMVKEKINNLVVFQPPHCTPWNKHDHTSTYK